MSVDATKRCSVYGGGSYCVAVTAAVTLGSRDCFRVSQGSAPGTLATRVGRQIGSATLVADGVHRPDRRVHLTGGRGGGDRVWLGFPLADPIVGLMISVAIFVLLWGAARDIGRGLLDGVDPALVRRAERTLSGLPGVVDAADLRMRWVGHRLSVEATVATDPAMAIGAFHTLEHEADQRCAMTSRASARSG